jgi:hypothetical protein
MAITVEPCQAADVLPLDRQIHIRDSAGQPQWTLSHQECLILTTAQAVVAILSKHRVFRYLRLVIASGKAKRMLNEHRRPVLSRNYISQRRSRTNRHWPQRPDQATFAAQYGQHWPVIAGPDPSEARNRGIDLTPLSPCHKQHYAPVVSPAALS